jgi:non-homologous end joining protein Ku
MAISPCERPGGFIDAPALGLVVVTMVLLYGDNVRPPDRKAQAIPTHHTTSPKMILLAKSEIRAMATCL